MEKNHLKEILTEKNYLKLSKVNADIHMINAIENLTEEYIGILTKQRPLIKEELAEHLNHSEQSEILGKIAMLCHEHGGIQMVIRTMNEINFKTQDIFLENTFKLENELNKLKK